MAVMIDGHVIWDPKWESEKKIGIVVSGAAALSILVVVLTFVSIITIETKEKMNPNNETTPTASNLGKRIYYIIHYLSFFHVFNPMIIRFNYKKE